MAGYLIPATITAEKIKRACAANGYSVMVVAQGEKPECMIESIIIALGRPVRVIKDVETAAHIRSIDGAPDCGMLNTALLPDGEWTDVVRRSDLDAIRDSDAVVIRELERHQHALYRTIDRLTDALSHIINAPPSIYDARNFRAIARAALREGEEKA
ncbi:hypothetical protein [Komagataeibacter sp. FNDCF1]|uniref:hypothetical protein n=1 Tax=Komagataeibacter sp. FNDCF1 TaxID=2878681 RepID=UPI001E2C5D7B|nr:hypothetical protein [Komagataeibacter sp. FNDCF1]MCE2566196.1 hypothetical protein [Komagataeibacter sp. FNDCF1]